VVYFETIAGYPCAEER